MKYKSEKSKLNQTEMSQYNHIRLKSKERSQKSGAWADQLDLSREEDDQAEQIRKIWEEWAYQIIVETSG